MQFVSYDYLNDVDARGPQMYRGGKDMDVGIDQDQNQDPDVRDLGRGGQKLAILS